MPTYRRPLTRVALLLVVLALPPAVGGCGGDDGLSEGDLAGRLEDEAGLSREQADCVAGEVFQRLSSDELDEVEALVSESGDTAEVPQRVRDRLEEAITACRDVG